MVHAAADRIAAATLGTPFEGKVWLVGGAVRDDLLGRPAAADIDLVVEGDAPALAHLLWDKRVSRTKPSIYANFGTAKIEVDRASVELVTARRESYRGDSRKPAVEPASLRQDARRRDFTVNALLRNIHTGEVADPLGKGLADLEAGILRTPLDPIRTFTEDPLRMLRAVRFKWTLGFAFAPEIEPAVARCASRVAMLSPERIQEEWNRMLDLPAGADAFGDMMRLGLIAPIAPEMAAMVGVDQGAYHHLDVWEHSLLVMRNIGCGDRVASLAALLHDIGKPPTRSVDPDGRVRFFGHETVGSALAATVLRRLRYPSDVVESVACLVKAHMRLGTAEKWTPSASRRLIRDMGDNLERLLRLVEADASALRPGMRVLNLGPLRDQIARALVETPRETLESPLSGSAIMSELGIEPGPEVGAAKSWLRERVLEGDLSPNDAEGARRMLRERYRRRGAEAPDEDSGPGG
ncbi:MAG: HDIG domain-containing metalloprotein [Fimbriimonadaceae bacterium]